MHPFLLTVSAEHALKLNELRSMLLHTRTVVLDVDGNEARPVSLDGRVLKGLLFVQMYAVLEALFTSLALGAVSEVRNFGVKQRHVVRCFHAVSLHSEFQSLVSTEFQKAPKFRKRIELLSEVDSENSCLPEPSMLQGHLQNARFDSIVEVFSALGIDLSGLGSTTKWLIDELVEKRNAVSHGRENASTVGDRYAIGEIERKVDSLASISQQLILAVEAWLSNREFIDSRHRPLYA